MKTKTILGALTVAAVTAALAVPVIAQTRGWGGDDGMHGRMQGEMLDFDTLDADKDGKITKEEIAAARTARIKAMDPDGDGFVTREEMLAHANDMARKQVEARIGDMFARMDTDGDGKLGAAEVMAAPMGGQRGMDRMFDRVDADSDGAVTRAEMDAAKARMSEGRRGGRDGQGEGRGDGHGKMHGKHGGHGKGDGQGMGHGQGIGQGQGQGQMPKQGN